MANSLLTPGTLADDRAILRLESVSQAAPAAASALSRGGQVLGSNASAASGERPAPGARQEITPLDFRQLVTAGLRGCQAPVDPEHVDVNDERPSGPLWFSVRLGEGRRPLPPKVLKLAGASREAVSPEGAQHLLLGSLAQEGEVTRITVKLIRLATLESIKAGDAAVEGTGQDPDAIYAGLTDALRRFVSLWLG